MDGWGQGRFGRRQQEPFRRKGAAGRRGFGREGGLWVSGVGGWVNLRTKDKVDAGQTIGRAVGRSGVLHMKSAYNAEVFAIMRDMHFLASSQ